MMGLLGFVVRDGKWTTLRSSVFAFSVGRVQAEGVS